MKRNTKTEQVAARVKMDIYVRLNSTADRLEIPAAQIIREGIEEKLDKLWETHPKLQEQAVC